MEEVKLKGLNETIYTYETKQGLKVYMWVNEKINSMFASLSVRYGSIHTKFKIDKKTYVVPNGIAHFLEHIKFNISEEECAHDRFYKLGGDANAFTTFEYTSYIVFAPKNKKENLKELLNFVYNPYFTEKTVSKEKGIIIEEAKMGLDSPYSVMFYDSMKNILQKSKYRNTITGTPDEVKSIKLDDINLIYDAFYHPKNMFLTITGNFNPYEMASEVENTLSKIEFKEYLKPMVITENEPRKVTKKYIEEEVNVSSPTVKIAIKMDISKFKDYTHLNLKLLTNLILNINFGSTSDFCDELIEKGLVQSLSTTCDIYDGAFVISILAKSSFKEEFIKRVKDKLDNLTISDTDFKRKKNALIATLILDYEDVENVNMKIQDDIIYNDGIVSNLKEIIENIEVTDLTNLIKLIDISNMSINVFKPKENQKDE